MTASAGLFAAAPTKINVSAIYAANASAVTAKKPVNTVRMIFLPRRHTADTAIPARETIKKIVAVIKVIKSPKPFK